MLNPFRTLAGRLIMVTIIAIAISHLISFWMFANERTRSIRRSAETTAIERMVAVYDRIRVLPQQEQAAAARAASDWGTRFAIATESSPSTALSDGARFARSVQEQIAGVEVHARMRQIQVDTPARFRLSRRGDPPPRLGDQPAPRFGDQPPGEQPPPDRPRRIRNRDGGEVTYQRRGPPDDIQQRTVTEVVADISLGQGRWFRTRAFLPAPRPVPSSLWFAALASMFAVGVGAVLISRQIGKPLAELAGAAERLGRGDMGAHAPVSGPEDVRRASTAFNAMADRLGRQLSRQRQMLWALSHDLRTPITALRLRAELVEDDATRQRLLGPLAEMETLTEQALSLARAGASEEARTEVDLAEIARTLCAELSEMGLNITAEAPAQVMTNCRPSEIARALRNLAENAAKYGNGGVMRVYREDGAAVAEVVDDGPGLAPDVLKRVTEPFFRADAARSEANGAGLGLAITQAIADGHGGKLVLENRLPHGLSVKLVLPA